MESLDETTSLLSTEEVLEPVATVADNKNTQTSVFQSLCVLELSSGIGSETVDFISSKIRSSRQQGGAQLMICKVPHDGPEVS